MLFIKILNIISFIISPCNASKKEKRTHQTIQQNLIKCIKIKLDKNQSKLSETLQDQLN